MGSDLSRQPVVFCAWDATRAILPHPARIIGSIGQHFPTRRPRPPAGLWCDRLHHPPVTHRLDGQAGSAATADPQDAASPDPKALHRDLREVTATRQLEVAPAVLGKTLAVERPDHPPAAGRIEPPDPRPGTPPLLPQDPRRQAGPGRGRQDRRWLGALGDDRLGVWPHPRGRCRSVWPLGGSRPQGDHRRHQHRRHHQVGGQKDDPEPAVPRRLSTTAALFWDSLRASVVAGHGE
jgi:hypothetical protein